MVPSFPVPGLELSSTEADCFAAPLSTATPIPPGWPAPGTPGQAGALLQGHPLQGKLDGHGLADPTALTLSGSDPS